MAVTTCGGPSFPGRPITGCRGDSSTILVGSWPAVDEGALPCLYSPYVTRYPRKFLELEAVEKRFRGIADNYARALVLKRDGQQFTQGCPDDPQGLHCGHIADKAALEKIARDNICVPCPSCGISAVGSQNIKLFEAVYISFCDDTRQKLSHLSDLDHLMNAWHLAPLSSEIRILDEQTFGIDEETGGNLFCFKSVNRSCQVKADLSNPRQLIFQITFNSSADLKTFQDLIVQYESFQVHYADLTCALLFAEPFTFLQIWEAWVSFAHFPSQEARSTLKNVVVRLQDMVREFGSDLQISKIQPILHHNNTLVVAFDLQHTHGLHDFHDVHLKAENVQGEIASYTCAFTCPNGIAVDTDLQLLSTELNFFIGDGDYSIVPRARKIVVNFKDFESFSGLVAKLRTLCTSLEPVLFQVFNAQKANVDRLLQLRGDLLPGSSVHSSPVLQKSNSLPTISHLSRSQLAVLDSLPPPTPR